MGEPLTERAVLAVVAQLCRERHQFDLNLISYAGWNLDPDMAGTLNLANLILVRLGYRPLEVFSGFRTCDDQRRLRDQGEDAAPQSWHTVGRAIDAHGTSDDVIAFRFVWTLLGGRAGVKFRDPSPNHYDLPYRDGSLPPPCW